MKQIAYIFLFLLVSCVNAYSQQKEIDRINKGLEKFIDDKHKECDEIKDKRKQVADSLNKAEQRLNDFIPTLTEEDIKNLLDKDLTTLLESASVKQKLMKCQDSKLAAVYLTVFNMKESLDSIYNKKRNDALKDSLDAVRLQLLDKHKDAFEKIASAIKNYRFVVSELARVFRVIDIDGDNRVSFETLKYDNELIYIVEIKYAKESIKNYIDGERSTRNKIKSEWHNACPDAFPN